ncbi:MAG: cardiolipin synthase [Eubacteriales bacterium]|nr:cardiolipin synthase [Eubacteriales bacterium]
MGNERDTKKIIDQLKEGFQKGRKGILGIIFGRSGKVFLAVLIQIGLLLLGFQFLHDKIFAAYGATMGLGFVLAIYIVCSEGNPDFKLVWIIPILVVPVFGALFYLFINFQWETRSLNQRVLEENASTSSVLQRDPVVFEELEKESPQMANLVSYICRISQTAVHQHTSTRYFPCGEDLLDTLLEKLRGAKKFIFLEYFIVSPGYVWDSILEILIDKAKEGVEIRFLYDGMCDIFEFPKNYPKELEKLGIQCKVFLPIRPALSTVQNNRDHRKILVIDGETAFTGGINLADEYMNRKERFGYWKDAAIMLEGDAVRSFTVLFLRMWAVVNQNDDARQYRKYLTTAHKRENDGFVIPYSDNPLDTERVAELTYMDILNTAKRYVHIMTPYLVLDHEMIVALTYAAKRGIDVKIIMPHIPDKTYAFLLARTYYNELLDAGVKIYEFLPGFVHSKIYVSDDEKAVVGSINMDYRSLYLSFECAALMYQCSSIMDIEADYQETLKKCAAVTKDTYNNEKAIEKFAGKILRFLAPLM